jgi:hypothetical protein
LNFARYHGELKSLSQTLYHPDISSAFNYEADPRRAAVSHALADSAFLQQQCHDQAGKSLMDKLANVNRAFDER